MVDFTDDQIKMRWREPYVTEGLNKKLAGVVPRGIYRGFRLWSDEATAMTVWVLADVAKGDHVAQYETDTALDARYSLRVEITSGNFSLDLTPWPSQTVYITIYAEYATLGTTLANVRVYTAAEYAVAVEKSELIILGKVDVPAAGAISAAAVTGSERTMPWENRSLDAVEWRAVIENGNFEDGELAAPAVVNEIPNWIGYPDSAGGDREWSIVDTDSYEGSRCAKLTVLVAGIPVASWLWGAFYLTPVEPGQRVQWKIAYKPVQTLSAGTMEFRLDFVADPGGGITSVSVHTLNTSVTGSWIFAEGMIEVPAGMHYLVKCMIGQDSGAIGWALPGDALLVDAVKLNVEPTVDFAIRYTAQYTRALFFRYLPASPTSKDMLLRATTNDLRMYRHDEDDTNVNQPNLSLPGSITVGRAAGWNQDLPVYYRPISLVGGLRTAHEELLRSGSYAYRTFTGVVEPFMGSLNANNTYGTNNWVADDSGQDAMRWYWTTRALRFFGAKAPLANPIVWETGPVIGFSTAVYSAAASVGYLHLATDPVTGGVPDWTAEDFLAKGQGLFTRNTLKAWAKVHVLAGTISFRSGFNISLTASPPVMAGSAVRLYFSNPLVNDGLGYQVSAICQALNTARVGVAVPGVTGQYIDLYAVDTASGAIMNLAGGGISDTLDVHVHGVFQ